MTQQQIQALIAKFSGEVNDCDIPVLHKALEAAPEENYSRLIALPIKSKVTTILLSIFLGGLGVDRFYVGDIGQGVGKLLVGWLTFGIWPFVDIFFSYKKAKKRNFEKIMATINGAGF